jgi:hypothetical protein
MSQVDAPELLEPVVGVIDGSASVGVAVEPESLMLFAGALPKGAEAPPLAALSIR